MSFDIKALRATRPDLGEEFFEAYEREWRFALKCQSASVMRQPIPKKVYERFYEGGLKQARKDRMLVTATFSAELDRLENAN